MSTWADIAKKEVSAANKKKYGKVMGGLQKIYPNPQAKDFIYCVDVQVDNGGSNNEMWRQIPIRQTGSSSWFTGSNGETVELTQNFRGQWEVTGVVNIVLDDGQIDYFDDNGNIVSEGNPYGHMTTRIVLSDMVGNWGGQRKWGGYKIENVITHEISYTV